MNKLRNVIIAVTFGLVTVLAVMAFTGPNNPPPIGNPTFWLKIGNDVYYNVSGGNVGIGTNGPAYKLDVQNGQINASGGLCIAGICKTGWDQITGTNYWILNGQSLYPNQTSYILGVGAASLDSNYKITTSGGGIKAESINQPAGYFSSASSYGLIVNSGNVGIGTIAPAYKLDVAGDVNISGSYKVNGNSYTSSQWTTNGNDIYYNTGNISIGTTSPGAKLEIAGQVKITGGSPGLNKVLTSDANGLGSWQASAGGAITGEIKIWSTGVAPVGYLFCDGSAVSRNTYVDLFAVMGTTYGSGDGSTTFNLPNLKGKVPVGYDAAQSEFNTLGKTGGAKSATPTVSGSNSADAASTMVAGGSNKGVAINAHSHSWSGSVSAVTTVPPYLTVSYIIKY